MSHIVGKKKLLTRVRKIKGQSVTLEKSLEGEPDCMTVLQQIAAIKGAVNGLMKEVLEGQEEDHEEGHIELTPEQIKFAEIGLEEAIPGNIREVLPLYGQVVTNEQGVQAVAARFAGVITKITKQIGDSVSQGEILANVESNDSLKIYSIKSSIAGVVIERNANVGEQTSDKTLFKVADFSTVWADLSAFPK